MHTRISIPCIDVDGVIRTVSASAASWQVRSTPTSGSTRRLMYAPARGLPETILSRPTSGTLRKLRKFEGPAAGAGVGASAAVDLIGNNGLSESRIWQRALIFTSAFQCCGSLLTDISSRALLLARASFPAWMQVARGAREMRRLENKT